MQLKQIKNLCAVSKIKQLSHEQIAEQMEFCTDALREMIADLKLSGENKINGLQKSVVELSRSILVGQESAR